MTRRTTYITTIQCWPSGKRYTYRGALDGPINQRSLTTSANGDNRWRKGTPEEWRAIRIATLVEHYSQHEILCDESALIDALITLSAQFFARGPLADAFAYPQIAPAAAVGEWWRVTRWLCGELRKRGAVVIDNAYGQWWGRTTRDQILIMDGTLQAIAAEYVQDEVTA